MGTQSKRRTDAEYKALGKMLEDLYLANNSQPLHLLGYSFLRGLAYGLGIFLAGTIVVAFLVWILSLFDQAPLIGPLVQNILNSLE
jgi:hypothetical protein